MRVTYKVRENVARRRGNLKQALHKKPITIPQLDFLKERKKKSTDSLKTK